MGWFCHISRSLGVRAIRQKSKLLFSQNQLQRFWSFPLFFLFRKWLLKFCLKNGACYRLIFSICLTDFVQILEKYTEISKQAWKIVNKRKLWLNSDHTVIKSEEELTYFHYLSLEMIAEKTVMTKITSSPFSHISTTRGIFGEMATKILLWFIFCRWVCVKVNAIFIIFITQIMYKISLSPEYYIHKLLSF